MSGYIFRMSRSKIQKQKKTLELIRSIFAREAIDIFIKDETMFFVYDNYFLAKEFNRYRAESILSYIVKYEHCKNIKNIVAYARLQQIC